MSGGGDLDHGYGSIGDNPTAIDATRNSRLAPVHELLFPVH